MSDDVRYTTGWDEELRQLREGHEWLDEQTARAYFRGDKEGIFAVDAARTDEAGAPLPRWAIAFSPTRSARVWFFDDRGSVWRSVDYLLTDGRLFRTSTDDYTYPDDGHGHPTFDAITHIRTITQPDGTGAVTVAQAGVARGERAVLADAPIEGFWLDVPAFGDWTDLTDPEFGIPPTEPTGS